MTIDDTPQSSAPPGKLDDFWMPFTANRQFKASPRLLESAEGMYFTATDGSQVLDGTAGLWCCNAGHGRREITEAVSKQVARLDFAPTFQMGHPLPFELASRLAAIAPQGLNKLFFTNSGSESADTALKIALAYQRAIGQGTRTRLIGRERGYHGVGFGGTSVGGIVGNRKSTARCCRASIIFPTPTTARSRPSPRVSRNMARISPTMSSGWSICTAPTPSLP